jgi:pimeloyl-ACP methyl ester carboxylesterase
MNRRKFLAATAASGLFTVVPRRVLGGNVDAYGLGTLPAGVRSRFVNNGNGLAMHLLEAGFETNSRPCVLLLHGFPELAYSWRKQRNACTK